MGYSEPMDVADSVIKTRRDLNFLDSRDNHLLVCAELTGKLKFSYITRNGHAFREALFSAISELTNTETDVTRLGDNIIII